jgi:TonB family protein
MAAPIAIPLARKAQLQWLEPFEYPAVATRGDEEGVARVRLTVAADGSVQSVQISRTSGYRSLDRHALFRGQTARGQAATDAQGNDIASTVELEIVYRLEPPHESAADQRQPIDERVRRRVLRFYAEAVAPAAAVTAKLTERPLAMTPEMRWPAGRRVILQAEVMPSGQMQKIALAQSSGDEALDRLAYDAAMRTRSIPLAQPIDGPITVQIELK